ncbi:MAG: M1 family metallopeptidase, partial [Anaerolineae bacterium]
TRSRIPTIVAPTPRPTPTSSPSPAIPDWMIQQQMAMTQAAGSDIQVLEHLTRYDIDLAIGVESLTLTGKQVTWYTNNEDVPLDELYFNLFPNSSRFGASMEIMSASIADQDIAFAYELDHKAVKVPLPQPLQPGQSTSVNLEFRARVPFVQENHYLVFVFAQGVFSLGDWHPMVAVYDEDGWNLEYPEGTVGEIVYSESAFYTVRVTLPIELQVIATGVEGEGTVNSDGSLTVVYYSGPVRDFHIVISDRYEVVSGTVGGTTINSYYWPEHEACGAEILWFASVAFNLYSQLFGPYPFTELDLVEADLWPWAIEWPGFILVGEPLYSNPQEVCGEWHVVHEVAHQWWYSVVGNDQVDEPWLDEALANYSTALYYRMVRDPEIAEATINEHIHQRYEAYVRAYGDGIVGGATRDYTRASYYPLVYAKGALFFEALQELMGDAAFFEGLRRYYREYKYGVATPQGFLAIMEQAHGQPLDEFHEHWILSAEGDLR